MYQTAEKFLTSVLLARHQRTPFAALVVPLALAIAATLIKRYLFIDTGQAVPFLLYFFVVLLSGCYGGSASALFAVPAIGISGALGLTGINSRPYLLLEWLFFFSEALLVAALFYFIEKAFTKLAHKEERFRRIIDQSAEGFIICDKDGIVTYCCLWLKRLLNFDPENKPLENAIADDDQRHLHYAIAKLTRKGGSMVIQLRLKQDSGLAIWTECCFNNLLNDPLVNAIVVQLRDVSKRVDQEKQREDFIHMASHELKTPVTAIRAFYSFLQGDLKRVN